MGCKALMLFLYTVHSMCVSIRNAVTHHQSANSCVGVAQGTVRGERLQDHAEQADNPGGQAEAGAGGYPE